MSDGKDGAKLGCGLLVLIPVLGVCLAVLVALLAVGRLAVDKLGWPVLGLAVVALIVWWGTRKPSKFD